MVCSRANSSTNSGASVFIVQVCARALKLNLPPEYLGYRQAPGTGLAGKVLLDLTFRLGEEAKVPAIADSAGGLMTPEFVAVSADATADGAIAAADVVIDEWYSTPEEHNNPLEPHTVVALWDGETLTLYTSTQHPHGVVSALAPALGLDSSTMRVVCPYIGGGFGSKGGPHAHDVLGALAAKAVPGRAVKFAVSRHDMFGYVGYRSPTASRVRLAARSDGRLTGIVHEAYVQSSHVTEFVEQAAVPLRNLYDAANVRTSHRAIPLDVPAPFWMRAPGEAPGMFAGEVAMDELAVVCGIDPVELRIRNEPESDPETGKPWSSRRLVECLREGAERFGWDPSDRSPGTRSDGRWLTGTGVAVATFPDGGVPAGLLFALALVGTGALLLGGLTVWAAVRERRRPVAVATLAVLACAVVGIVGGGSWWRHYALQLALPLALGAALAVRSGLRRTTRAAVALALAATFVAVAWRAPAALEGRPSSGTASS